MMSVTLTRGTPKTATSSQSWKGSPDRIRAEATATVTFVRVNGASALDSFIECQLSVRVVGDYSCNEGYDSVSVSKGFKLEQTHNLDLWIRSRKIEEWILTMLGDNLGGDPTRTIASLLLDLAPQIEKICWSETLLEIAA